MTKTRSILACLPLSLLVTPSAFALSTDREYDLRIEGTPVGSLALRHRVTEDSRKTVCQYTGRWTGLAGALKRTRLCRFEEYKASDYFDCEQNRRTFFPTIVRVPEGGCGGYDEFGQAVDIPVLIAGESPGGELYGIIVTSSVGDVQTFEMSARRLPPPSVQAPTDTLQPRQPPEKMPILILG